MNIRGSGFCTPCSNDSVKTSTSPPSPLAAKYGRMSMWMSLITAIRSPARWSRPSDPVASAAKTLTEGSDSTA